MQKKKNGYLCKLKQLNNNNTIISKRKVEKGNYNMRNLNSKTEGGNKRTYTCELRKEGGGNGSYGAGSGDSRNVREPGHNFERNFINPTSEYNNI
ncbi:hypothetical protein QL285_006937 [Trifolium repens]|nr:hypothetical protein QL285_006937 [Trifolium repens]